MIINTTVTTLRNNLGEMLRRVQHARDSVVISRYGRPVAVLIDVKRFDRIRRVQERFDQLAERFAGAYVGLPEAEGSASISDAVADERTRVRRLPTDG